MIVLSYGYKKPEDGDRGSVWFPSLSDNITRLNGHAHDGVDSAPITGANITTGTVSAPAASWGSAIIANKYRQLLTVPAGYSMTGYTIQVRLSTGDLVNSSIEKVSNTTFYIYTLDNTQTLTVNFR